MSWLALSPLQVALLWLAASALALWLYLHQRPMHRRVSTLRFWSDLPPSVYRRRRWLREPWAFLAQVLFLLFLILALANPRWGSVTESRRVVLVLDASIWSQVQRTGELPWIDGIRQDADRALNQLPVSDEVLLLRAEADALPILPFSRDRAAQRRAIAQTRPSSASPDVSRALEAGRAALAGSARGLLIYVGAGMVDEEQSQRIDRVRQELAPADGSGDHAQFLVHLVGGNGPIENHGITRLALQRDSTDPATWHLLTQLKNYSASKANLVLKLSVGNRPLMQRVVSLAPGQVLALNDEFATAQGGLLQAEISPSDDLRADDRAVVYVPPFRPVNVSVVTSRSSFENDLRPVLSANPYLRTTFAHPGTPLVPPPDVTIYDTSAIPVQPVANSIYFVRGQGKVSPRPIRVTAWSPQHAVTRWVRTRDVSVRNAAAIRLLPSDVVLASGEGNPPVPLVVAREQNRHKILIVGFDPHDSNFPEQSGFPLLLAGSVEWLTRPIEDASDSLSAGELDLPGPATRVISPFGYDVPFAREGSNLHLLALDTGLYRVVGTNRTATFAVNTPPLLSSQRIEPTPAEKSLIQSEAIPYQGNYLWRWLTILAILALWCEWWLFYSSRINRNAALAQQLYRDGAVRKNTMMTERPAEHDEALDPNFIT
jgi:aerotolerance regulator-like protein